MKNIEKTIRYFQKTWWHHQQDDNIFEIILLITARIHDHLPYFLKKKFIITFDTIGLFIFRINNLLTSFFSKYYLIYGVEKQTEKRIIILYKGTLKSLSFFSNKFYKKNVKIHALNKKEIHRLKNKNNTHLQEYPDLFIKKTDMFYRGYYQKNGYYIIPELVTFELNTTSPIEKIRDNFSKDIISDIKKAKKTGYTYEIYDDMETFRFFYYQMYLPYVSWKHKNKKRIVSYATICHLVSQGSKLLIIKHKKEFIFGGIFLNKKNKIKTYYAGLRKGKFGHIHNGVMALSYYYLIKIAKDYGCHFIDFGTARPFLNDGLYSYKNKWGMNVIPTSPFFSNIFAIKIINNHPVIEQFIHSHPSHYFKGKKLSVLQSLNQKN